MSKSNKNDSSIRCRAEKLNNEHPETRITCLDIHEQIRLEEMTIKVTEYTFFAVATNPSSPRPSSLQPRSRFFFTRTRSHD